MSTILDTYGLSLTPNPYDFSDKQYAIRTYVETMLLRLQSLFKYDGLPETIPQKVLELYTQVNGHCAVFEHDGKLYCAFGGWGGEPDEYYIPKQYIIANPYLNVFETFDIGENCVVIPNDSLYRGVMPLCNRYATLMTENDITMRLADINQRIIALIEAPDDRTKHSAEKYISDIENGKQGVIASNAFLDGIRAQPLSSTSQHGVITSLIEYHQYLKASWFNDFGLNANYNMKRESITANESQLNDDMLLPLIDNMLLERRQALKKVNEIFGTDISVDYDSSWKDNVEEYVLEMKTLANDSNSPNDSHIDTRAVDGAKRGDGNAD